MQNRLTRKDYIDIVGTLILEIDKPEGWTYGYRKEILCHMCVEGDLCKAFFRFPGFQREGPLP